jgi:hypothetical protein
MGVSLGYGSDGLATIRAALEARRDFLRAELARAAAMLADESPEQQTRSDASN